ncbi:MAG: hypothetical protein AB1792_09945 [Candidatus Zixiibacteriota bacterium]
MNRRWLPAILLLAYAAGASASEEGGTQPPVSFGVGARDLAMGGAAVGVGDFTAAPYWNASRLAMAERLAIGFSLSQLYETGVAYQYLGVAVPTLDFGTFGFGVFSLGVDGIETRDAGNLLLGETSDDYLDLYLAYGRIISGNNVGLAVTLQHHTIGDYNATTSPGVNLSLSRRVPIRIPGVSAVTITSSGTNLIQPRSGLTSGPLQFPRQFDGGMTIGLGQGHRGTDVATVSAALRKSDRRDWSVAAGSELRWRESVAARAGYRDGHFSLGAGFAYKSAWLDYALVDRDMGLVHMFTLSVSLGSSTSDKRARRAERREAEFSSLFQQRLQSKNGLTVDRLLAQADSLRGDGELADAIYHYERALFITKSSGLDTTRAVGLLADARAQYEAAVRAETFSRYRDSAQAKSQAGDWLAAKYFASLAVQEYPTSPEAQQLLEQTTAAIADLASREELLNRQLRVVDSLLSYGRLNEANVAASSLKEYAPNDDHVLLAWKRVRFETWRQKATTAFTDGDIASTRRALDSAVALFPQHQWCQELRSRLDAERRLATSPLPKAEVAPSRDASREEQKKADDLCETAQEAFREGRLRDAVTNWEEVERIVPDYKSVRAYLVQAYRLVGIELYGQNQLNQAIAVWRKAEALNPDDREIKAYIERTESEILRVKELSYDQH